MCEEDDNMEINSEHESEFEGDGRVLELEQ